MNISRYHAEWLSLVEVSGPFVSMPVLLRTFPQGLDELDAGQRRDLRANYETWLERGQKHAGHHHAWVRYVLTRLLDYPDALLAEGQSMPPGMEAVLPRFHETLRPDLALKSRDAGNKPVLLISVFPPGTRLESPLPEHNWKASPATRMMELLHATGITTGLVTNGEQWLLVYARCGEATGFASWYADLWMQEPVTLLAFRSLMHLRRFFGVAAADTLPSLLDASSHDQQEVTDQLGFQVRQAVEVLVQAFDRIDAESARTLLAGVDEPTLYSASLTIMMRLVFVFAAEERGMLLLGQNAFYDENYALSPLRDSLRERADQHGEEVLERRYDAWCRLLAAFRAIHGGVEHEAMRLPAYGGALFDPDRYPFLEGRAAGTAWAHTPAKPLQINNRVVLHLLEALQLLRVKLSGGGPAEMRRLSFRALDIEQIGHVYEGLLDHTVKRAPEVVLELTGAKDKEPEIPLSKLEALARSAPSQSAFDSAPDQSDLVLMVAEREQGVTLPEAKAVRYDRPSQELLDFLKEETGRQPNSLTKSLAAGYAVDEHRLQRACGNDQRLVNRVRPFAALIREDSFNQLVVIPEGSCYVTRGSDRRSSGTHYTPRSLTEPIVQHTLEPLVYVGPAEGKPESEWVLKSPKELLDLRVCDLAMGSAAFLVQTCRYLSERLVEAWETIERANPEAFLKTPDGELSTGDPSERLLPADSEERLAIARRIVADRCLYGVDINPMAVEMAKLSLWLITLHKDRPFTFLDHALKCGDSLLGVTSVKQIENFSLKPGGQQMTFATANLFRYVEDAAAKRRALESLASNDHTQIEAKIRLHTEAESSMAKVKALADCLISFEYRGVSDKQYEEQRVEAAYHTELAMRKPLVEFQSYACDQLHDRHPFHWAVEFPEVFERGGFDAFVGNPPFVKGHFISQHFGDEYRDYLADRIHGGSAGLADLCAFFVRRAYTLLLERGCAGLIATNTISDGDTRKVGLDSIQELGGVIVWANPDVWWYGDASVVVSPLVIKKGPWSNTVVLAGKEVNVISASLEAGVNREVMPLLANDGKAFVGSYLLGDGFILTSEEAVKFQQANSNAKKVVLPYINGVEFNTFPNLQPRRFAICFWDWPLSNVREYTELFERIDRLVKPVRDEVERDRNRCNWWLHAENRPGLYHAVGLGCRFQRHPKGWNASSHFPNRVIAKAKTSDTWAFGFLSATTIFDQALTIIADDDFGMFAVLQSAFHEVWARESGVGSKMKLDQRYSASMFEPYPFPTVLADISGIGCLYEETRSRLMLARQEGLTKTYNRFHNVSQNADEIVQLRTLQKEMDQAVAGTYGWGDLDLGHGFHETKQGIRYTISESARRIVLDRLLALNHERYAEEVRAGLHDKKKPAAGNKKAKKESSPVEQGTAYLPTELPLMVDAAPKRSTRRYTSRALYCRKLVLSILALSDDKLPLERLLSAWVTMFDLKHTAAMLGNAQDVVDWARLCPDQLAAEDSLQATLWDLIERQAIRISPFRVVERRPEDGEAGNTDVQMDARYALAAAKECAANTPREKPVIIENHFTPDFLLKVEEGIYATA